MAANEKNYQISDEFIVNLDNTYRQYNKIYIARLEKLRERINLRTQTYWDAIPKPMCDLNFGERAVVCGIVYRSMKLQLTVIQEIQLKLRFESFNYLKNYTSNDDEIFIQDEFLRCRLVGVHDTDRFVTGIVIGAIGTYGYDGTFTAEEILFPGLPPNIITKQLEQNQYVLFLSGLHIGKNEESEVSLQLLADLLNEVIDSDTDDEILRNVCHVIIAGNLYDNNLLDGLKFTFSDVSLCGDHNIVAHSQILDSLLFQLSMNVPVTVMPGEYDPCYHVLPQQPLYEGFFPHSQTTGNFNLTTNPAKITIDGYELLGMSGQNIKTMSEYSRLGNFESMCRLCFDSNLIFPNTPENRGCYMMNDRDPFIIDHIPRVFFSGSSDSFQRSIFSLSGHTSLCLAIQDFSETLTAVIVNLRNLE